MTTPHASLPSEQEQKQGSARQSGAPIGFSYLLTSLALLAVGALVLRLSLHFSRRGFTGYDLSPMIDAGWRVLLGQAPGKDFIVTFPPSLYLTIACPTFGVSLHAIALGEGVLYVAIMVLGPACRSAGSGCVGNPICDAPLPFLRRGADPSADQH